MRWSIYLVFLLVALAFDASVGGVLRIASVQPRIVPATVVFALFAAPRLHAVRIAFLAGLLCDLLSPSVRSDGTQLVVIGPWTLGFALGALAVVPLRSLLYHRNPFSGGFAVIVFSLLASVVFVAIWSARILFLSDELPAWWPGSGAAELWRQAKSSFANGVIAIPALWILGKSRALWGFSTAKRVVPGAAREIVER